MDLSGTGKLLLVLAGLLAAVGVLLILAGKGVIPRLPGDLVFGKENIRVFVPLGTSILLSVVLTVVLNLILRR